MNGRCEICGSIRIGKDGCTNYKCSRFVSSRRSPIYAEVCDICGSLFTAEGYCSNSRCIECDPINVIIKESAFEADILQKLDTIINLLQQRKDM